MKLKKAPAQCYHDPVKRGRENGLVTGRLGLDMDHSMPPASSLGGYEADERLAARHATTLAEESWRSLCTANASTFVAAERRTAQIQRSLKDLLSKIETETKPSTMRVSKALDPKYQPEDEEEEEGSDEIQPATELLADLAEKHRLRRRTLMQHSSLLELLELPSLMGEKNRRHQCQLSTY